MRNWLSDRKHARIPVLMLLLVLVPILLLSVSAAAEEAFPRNSAGIPNRPVSVDPTGLIEGFSAVLFDNSNGLPTSEANAITQTGDGFIWIGSYAGLIRYDGNTFERIELGGLASIKCLYTDSLGRLWIGTNDNGVAMLDRGELRKWGKPDGMHSDHTRAITEGPDGTVYVATTHGIAMIGPDFSLAMLEGEGVTDADMRSLLTGPDGTLFGTTDTADLMIIRDRKLVRCIPAAENPLKGAGTIFPDPAGGDRLLQEAPDYGLYRVDLSDGGFKVLEKLDIGPLKYLMSMEYIDGKIWITAGNGIGVLDGGRFSLLDNLPLVSSVGHVITDYLGNLWFTSTRQGVMKVVPNQFSDLFARFGLEPAVVNSTCMDDEGRLYAATDTGLIVLDKNGPVQSVPLTKAVTASGEDLGADDLVRLLDGVRIRSIISDSRGRLWISTWRALGLLCCDHGEVTAYRVEDGLLSTNVRAVYEARDGRILVALTGGANVIRDGAVTASFGKDDGIVNIESLTVAEGLNGETLIGSNGGGIYIFGEDGLKTVNVEEGLPSDIVMRLKPDRKRNVVWIVTSSAIAFMTPDYRVTTVEKFPYSNNFDLYENSKGDMWVLCSSGIYVVPADEMAAGGDISAVFYGRASGLPVIATVNSYSALTADGSLYIAGSTGICKVNIEQDFENVSNLKTAIPYVEANGKRIYPVEKGTFVIPAATRKLTIPSFVFNYDLNNPRVSYQLEGFDESSASVRRSELKPVDYTNLRGGDYHFVMTVQDSMGRGDKEISVLIRKEHSFYEETWFIVLAAFGVLFLLVSAIGFFFHRKARKMEQKHREAREQFEQTAEALAGAIDAKDRYTNGHSRRVAEYSRAIAREAGKSDEEVDRIYFAALLHDVGKIGVPLVILSKKGKLTDEEFAQIRQHPVTGGQILSSIRHSPWLSIGARYHHERYNGRGYPEGLKGEEIPEIARIIAVADAYDAMTSNRSYRNAIPQHIVREEIVKGSGSQFDPQFAEIMLRMIDRDTEYQMREDPSRTKAEAAEAGTNRHSLRCDSLYHECSKGVAVRKEPVRISLCSQPDMGAAPAESLPSLVLYDSLDGQVHPGQENDPNVLYREYARIRMDGQVAEGSVRKAEVRDRGTESILGKRDPYDPIDSQRYAVEAVRDGDRLNVRISGVDRSFEVILSLPDGARSSYIAITGENCDVHNIRTETA